MQKYIFFFIWEEKNKKKSNFFLQLKKKNYFCNVKTRKVREEESLRVFDNKHLNLLFSPHIEMYQPINLLVYLHV